MNELLEWLKNVPSTSAATVRSLLTDQGTDVDALRDEATALLKTMTETVETDPGVTAEAIRAVRTILAAVAPPTVEDGTSHDQDDTADADESSDATGAADEATDTDVDETPTPDAEATEPGDTADADDDGEPEPNDGGGAVTLDSNQGDTAPDKTPLEGEVISAEAFKAGGGKTTMTMDRPAVAARFSDAAATVEQYQAFAGGTGKELHTAGNVADHVNDQLDLLRGARGSSDPRGVSLVQYRAREGAFKFHRDAEMSRREVSALVDAAVIAHEKEEFANGFCSPSVQKYEFCPIPSPWGMFGSALPIITSERGGTEWPSQPSVGSLWGQGVECRTEAEEIARAEAGTPKACTHLDCPTWTDYRNRICHICVTSDILSNRAFPEYTDQSIRTFELMYEYWVNWQMLQTAIGIADEQNGEIRWDTAGWGIFQALKEKVTFAIDSLSARSLFDPWATTWNVALPYWAYGALQADLAKRVGADLALMGVGREPIEMAIRGGRTVRFWPQLPWQQALTEDVPDPAMRTWMGSDTSLQGGVYPDTMELLIWPQGALVGVRDDFLDIRARWDYQLQQQNQQLELFAETEWNVIPRCGEILHITLDICTAGRSGSLFEYPCNPAPVPPEGAALSAGTSLTVDQRAMAGAVAEALNNLLQAA